MRRLLSTFRGRSEFGFNVATLTGGMVASQAILVCATPFLTRYYTASDFGQVHVYLSLYVFVFVVIAWKYELAIPLPEKDEVAASVVVVALTAVVVTVVVTTLLLAIIQYGGYFPPPYRYLQPYVWLWPATLLGGGVYLVVSQWAMRRGLYTDVTTTRITQTASQVGLQLLLVGRLPSGVWSLLVGDAIGRVIGTLRLARICWRRDSTLFRALSPADIWGAAHRYARFPLVSTTSAVVNTAGFAVPALMIGGLFSPQVLGWYALVDRVLGVPSVVVGVAASQAYTMRMAQLVRSNPRDAQRFFNKVVAVYALLGIVPFAVPVLFGPYLFALFFGAEWREAGVYARLLALPHFVSFIAGPVMPTLNVVNRQDWQFAWDCSRLLIACGAIWGAARFGADPTRVVAAYGLAMIISYGANAVLCYVALRRATSAASGLHVAS